MNAGRPSDPKIDVAVHDAVLSLLADGGWRGLSIERIAAAAGVARTTLYRRYGTVHGILLAVMGDIYGEVPVPDTGSVERDLIALMRDVAAVWREPAQVTFLAALVAAQHEDPALAAAYREQFRHRRAATQLIVAHGIERGELRAGTDGDLLLDFLAGIVAQRVLLRREPLERGFAQTVVRQLLAGYRR